MMSSGNLYAESQASKLVPSGISTYTSFLSVVNSLSNLYYSKTLGECTLCCL